MKLPFGTILFVLILAFACEKKEMLNTTGKVSFTVSELREVEGATIPLSINLGIDNFNHDGGKVNVAIEGGEYGRDYTSSIGAASGDIQIEAGKLLEKISIQPIDDNDVEEDVNLTIRLNGATGSLQLGEITELKVSLLDDDNPVISMVSFAAEAYEIDENSSEPIPIKIRLDKTNTSAGTITIQSSGSAIYGTDFNIVGYNSDKFSIDVSSGADSIIFEVEAIDNDVADDDKAVIFTIEETTGGLIAGNNTSATLTILNDDASDLPAINFSVSNPSQISEDGGDLTINLDLSVPLIGNASVLVEIGSGSTAILGEDFKINSADQSPLMLNLEEAASSSSFILNIIDDEISEELEELTLSLSVAQGGLVVGEAFEYNLKIEDNDAGGSFEYVETFESFDLSDTFLTDILGWQRILINQTIPDKFIGATYNEGKFSDIDDPGSSSDNGLNFFYNSQTDPSGTGEIDHVIISPLMEASGNMQVMLDIAYAFKNQNSGEVSIYWSQTYMGDEVWNEGDWTQIGTETVANMDGEGFGNNDFKREDFSINPTENFYISIRLSQTVDEDNYRLIWRFDNLKVSSQ